MGFKKKFGEDIGIGVEIFGQDNETNFEHLKEWKNAVILNNVKDLRDIKDSSAKPQNDNKQQEDIVALIQFLNSDDACVGIIVQLPLPDPLWTDTAKITQHIHPSKDIDAMGGMIYGMDSFGTIDFLGATPQAAMTLLKQYNLDNVRGKTVSIIGQSNLIGKPLATHLMKK